MSITKLIAKLFGARSQQDRVAQTISDLRRATQPTDPLTIYPVGRKLLQSPFDGKKRKTVSVGVKSAGHQLIYNTDVLAHLNEPADPEERLDAALRLAKQMGFTHWWDWNDRSKPRPIDTKENG